MEEPKRFEGALQVGVEVGAATATLSDAIELLSVEINNLDEVETRVIDRLDGLLNPPVPGPAMTLEETATREQAWALEALRATTERVRSLAERMQSIEQRLCV